MTVVKTITIRGKELNSEFAKKVTKKRFCEIYAHLRKEAVQKGWSELLKATGRTEKKPSKSEKKEKSS